MTVDTFGDQTVQAVATVLLAALSLLGAVMLAVGMIVQRRAQALAPAAIVLSRAAARLTTHRTGLQPPTERFAASLPTRAPPLSLQRPSRMSPQPDDTV